MDVTLEIEGLDQLDRNLRALEPELAKKALTDALVGGGQVLADEMEAQAPRRSEDRTQHIADNIIVQVERKPQGSAAEVYVGPSRKVAYKARWMEFGAAAHPIAVRRKKTLASPDQVFGSKVGHPGNQPRPFMRPALETAGETAIKTIGKKLEEGIAAAAATVNRK